MLHPKAKLPLSRRALALLVFEFILICSPLREVRASAPADGWRSRQDARMSFASPKQEMPSPPEIVRQLRSQTACGIDFHVANSILDQIERWVGQPLSPPFAHEVGSALGSLGETLRGNPCIETCNEGSVDPIAFRAVARLRSLTLIYFRNSALEPVERRAAMVSTLLLRLGPNYWRTGFEAVISDPLTPPPHESWSSLHEKSGLHYRFDLETWKVGYTPAGILRRISDQHAVTDFRLDIAALIVASQLPPSQRHGLFRDYEIKLHDYRSLHWKLNDVKESLQSALSIHRSRTGRLPQRLHDLHGNLLIDCCPESSPHDVRLPECWFRGWPGVRIFDYEVYGDICLMRTVGFGFDYEAPWWMAFE